MRKIVFYLLILIPFFISAQEEMVTCKSCSGSGITTCGGCGGKGYSFCFSCAGNGRTMMPQINYYTGMSFMAFVNCFKCNGSGKQNCFYCQGKGGNRCGYCDGKGKYPKPKPSTSNSNNGYAPIPPTSNYIPNLPNGTSQPDGRLCRWCNGAGRCSYCSGTGKNVIPNGMYVGENSHVIRTCDQCHGSGNCRLCHGKGTIR